MSDFTLKISSNIIVSSYGISRLGEYAHAQGSKYIIVIDRILKEFDIYNKILQSLDDRQIEYFIFDDLAEGATTQIIDLVLVLARKAHINGVIAVGGAKSIHAGQVLAALCNEKRELYDFVDGAIPSEKPLPCICVPTTLREVFVYTQYAPVTDSRYKQVKLINLKEPVCSTVLIDPTLVAMLSENQKATMAIEAICLASEAYLSQKSSFFSDMLAEKSIELLSYALDGSPTKEISSNTYELLTQAGCMASIAAAISAPGVCSILAMALNIRYEISSSLAVSILFPHFIEKAASYKLSKIAKLSRIFRAADENQTDEEAVKSFAENIRIRLAKMNLPTRIKDLGLEIEQLSLVVEDAGKLPLMSTLSRSMTSDDLFAFLKTAF